MRSNLEKNSSYGIAVSDPASALKPSEKPGEHGRHVSIAPSLFLPLLPSSGVFPTVTVHSSGPPSGILSDPGRSSTIAVLCSGAVTPQQCLDIWGSDGQG